MATRDEVKLQPPDDLPYPKCPICQWYDRKLRIVGSAVTPEQRIELHLWARHGKGFPSWGLSPPEAPK